MRTIILLILLLLFSLNSKSAEVGGIINSNTIWTVEESPYIVISNILVAENASLTIQPGVVVKFNDFYLYVDGLLYAVGLPENYIRFTSNQSIPQNGDWKEIKFRDSSQDATFDESNHYISGCIMKYCIVEFASNASERRAINIENSAPYLDNLIVQYNAYYGISWISGSPKITNCLIRNNSGGNGMGMAGDPYSNSTISNPIIENCIIENNNYGIILNRGHSIVKNCQILNNK
jgi:hypothetical protein